MNRQETAQILALRALAWLAGDEELIAAFLAQTGTAAAELRERAGDPEVLAAVLDFILAEDQRVLAFTADVEEPPEALLRARAELPGGDLPHWS